MWYLMDLGVHEKREEGACIRVRGPKERVRIKRRNQHSVPTELNSARFCWAPFVE